MNRFIKTAPYLLKVYDCSKISVRKPPTTFACEKKGKVLVLGGEMVVELTDANFDKEVLQQEGIVMVDFWAPWCGPCQIMGPIVEEIGKEYEGKVKVGKVNVDENPVVSSRFQITSIPTLLIFKNGIVVKQLVGIQTKETLQEELDSFLSRQPQE